MLNVQDISLCRSSIFHISRLFDRCLSSMNVMGLSGTTGSRLFDRCLSSMNVMGLSRIGKSRLFDRCLPSMNVIGLSGEAETCKYIYTCEKKTENIRNMNFADQELHSCLSLVHAPSQFLGRKLYIQSFTTSCGCQRRSHRRYLKLQLSHLMSQHCLKTVATQFLLQWDYKQLIELFRWLKRCDLNVSSFTKVLQYIVK